MLYGISILCIDIYVILKITTNLLIIYIQYYAGRSFGFKSKLSV